jgi:hypothetical protein
MFDKYVPREVMMAAPNGSEGDFLKAREFLEKRIMITRKHLECIPNT